MKNTRPIKEKSITFLQNSHWITCFVHYKNHKLVFSHPFFSTKFSRTLIIKIEMTVAYSTHFPTESNNGGTHADLQTTQSVYIQSAYSQSGRKTFPKQIPGLARCVLYTLQLTRRQDSQFNIRRQDNKFN